MPNNYQANDDLGNRSDEIDEEVKTQRLVFPLNVYDSLKAAGQLTGSEKTGLILSLWFFCCAVLGWFLASWLRTIIPNYYIWILIGIEVFLQLTVGIYIFRYSMDERSLFSELDENDQSFSNYFKIYKELKESQNSKYPFDLIEFDDGSYGVFIECRLGYNTQQRSTNTYFANKAVDDILNKNKFARKVYYHNEDFKSSRAAQEMRDVLKGIHDPDLFTVYRDMIQNYLRIAEDESNVLCVTYVIYAQTRIQKDEIIPVINQVMTAFQQDETVYRQVSILRYEEIVEFFQHYYNLEILDMGEIRAFIAEKRNVINCPVRVMKLYGKSGKIYTGEEFDKLGDEIISLGGLVAAN